VQKRLYEASREVETQMAADNEAVRGLVALLASVSRDTVGARLR